MHPKPPRNLSPGNSDAQGGPAARNRGPHHCKCPLFSGQPAEDGKWRDNLKSSPTSDFCISRTDNTVQNTWSDTTAKRHFLARSTLSEFTPQTSKNAEPYGMQTLLDSRMYIKKGAPHMVMSSSIHTTAYPIRYPGHFNYKPHPNQNPHVVLTHDIVRNTKTLHFEINTSEPLSPNREYQKSMKGYFGVMTLSVCSSCDLHGNGEKVHLEDQRCLWQPKNTTEVKDEPLWHLRVSVLKDQEARGDCQSRRFVSFVPEQQSHDLEE